MRQLNYSITMHPGKLTSDLVAALGHVSTGGKIHGVTNDAAHSCIVLIEDDTSGAQETTIAGIVAAHNPTPPATPIQTYVDAFKANKKAIADIYMTFHEGFRLSNGSLGAFQTLIANTLTKINALPTGFTTEFQNERTAYYTTRFGTPPADDMASATLAQCQTYYDFLKPWVAALMAGLGASLATGLDNGS